MLKRFLSVVYCNTNHSEFPIQYWTPLQSVFLISNDICFHNHWKNIYIYINSYDDHSSFTSIARSVKTFQNISNKQVNQTSENQNFVHGFCSLRNAYSNPSHPPILNCIMNGVTFIGHDKSPSRSGPMMYSELNFDVSTIQPDTFL